MPTVVLTEHVQSTSRLRVDRENGVIYGAKLLGWDSANGRRYLPEGVDPSMYSGRVINANHVKPGQERSVYDRIGMIKNPVKRKDGVYGNLHLLKSHPLAPAMLEAAEAMPGVFGLSHSARGRTSHRHGDAVVEAVEAIESVDLVSSPASTRGLHECLHESRRPARERLDRTGRVLRRVEVRRRLREESPRLARLLETCEIGLMGLDKGEAESGISSPAAKSDHPEEKTRRKVLRDKVMALLDDSSRSIDDTVKALADLLADPDVTKSDAEAQARQESAFAPFRPSPLPTTLLQEARAAKRLAESRGRRASSRVPGDRSKVAAWLNGGSARAV